MYKVKWYDIVEIREYWLILGQAELSAKDHGIDLERFYQEAFKDNDQIILPILLNFIAF
jgi:hypothetical protein